MDKPWFVNYQQGVPYEIDITEHASLASLFEDACHQYSHLPAYVSFGYELTYQELDNKSRQFAIYLQQLGLKKGTRVALMMPNILQYPITLFAVLRAGFTVVNINPLYTADEVIHQLNDSNAEAIIVIANYAFTIEKALPQIISLKHIVITEIADCLPWFKRIIINNVVKYLKKMVPTYCIKNSLTFNQALAKAKNKMLETPSLTHQDIAFLQYTGGTTGIAKGAILTHGNMVANVLQAYYWIKPLCLGDRDTIVTALPLYHIFSLTANCLTFLKIGAKNILIVNPRDIDSFINTIKNSQFTAITGVNTLFNALLNCPKLSDVDFSRLKLALSGGMSLQKSVALRWKEMTKTRVLEAYGLTETCPAVTINPMYLNDYNGSIGLPLSSTEITIRDEQGLEVAGNASGELCVKGPQVMAGYWQRPDETAAVFTTDGFLKTGDMARIDDQGFVYLVDRKKDMIIVSGFNVYPNEVEQIIGLMPEVLEVGVIGVNNHDGGERVKACIVKKDMSLTTEKVIAHCREHLTRYKVPKIVEFYQELPKTNVGKILRRALR